MVAKKDFGVNVVMRNAPIVALAHVKKLQATVMLALTVSLGRSVKIVATPHAYHVNTLEIRQGHTIVCHAIQILHQYWTAIPAYALTVHHHRGKTIFVNVMNQMTLISKLFSKKRQDQNAVLNARKAKKFLARGLQSVW